MRKMLLSVLAVAAVSLSSGAVWAEQTVQCSPGCGLVNASAQGKTSSQNMNQNAKTNNQSGLGQDSSGDGNTGSGSVAF